jgi:hypothetical protein
MTTANIGIRSGNVIVPYVSTTKQSKLLTATSVVTISDSFNTTYAFVQFEADSSNNWTMHFFVEGDGSASKAENWSIDITIPGIVTKNVGAVGQTFNCKMLAAVWRIEEAGAAVNSNTFGCINRSGSTLTYTRIVAQGSILLGAEPTWASLGTTAAAALEGVLAADVYIAPASASASGLVDTSAQSFAGNKTLTGFTSFGSGNSGLKCKVLSGTTAAAEGGVTTVAHGLTGDKIISITAVVRFASNTGVPPNYGAAAGYEYFVVHTATNAQIELHTTNSENILSKTFYVTIWYLE